jgi:hypothetical protein
MNGAVWRSAAPLPAANKGYSNELSHAAFVIDLKNYEHIHKIENYIRHFRATRVFWNRVFVPARHTAYLAPPYLIGSVTQPSVEYSCTIAVDRKSIALAILQCYVQCLYTRMPIATLRRFSAGSQVRSLRS